MGFNINKIYQKIKAHVHTYHIVIIVIIVINAMLTLCYFHNVNTISLLLCIHVNNANLLNITCTLVAQGVLLKRLECVWFGVAPRKNI